MTTTAKTPARTATRTAAAKPAAKAAAKTTAAKAAPKPATKVAKAEKPAKVKPKAYILLTGVDDSVFCQRVSDKIKEGYELYGSPAVTFNGKNVIAAQALVFKGRKKGKK